MLDVKALIAVDLVLEICLRIGNLADQIILRDEVPA